MENDYLALVSWLCGLTLFVITVVTACVVISENRNPVRSLAWLTVLTVVPVFGLMLYFIFGRDVKSKRAALSRSMKRKLRRREKAVWPNSASIPLADESRQLIKVAGTLTGNGIHTGNGATVYDNGREMFDALIKDIEGATRYVYIQFYIIENDEVGRRLQQALIGASSRGVKVYLIYDPVGSVGTGKKFFKSMESAGVVVKPFIPVRFPGFGVRINWRNHRKQCVIDGAYGYVGGMNIADRYVDGGREFDSWRDIHVRVSGSVVRSIESSFVTDWGFMGDDFDALFDEQPLTSEGGELTMQVVTSGPTSQWANIELLFLRAIGRARRRIYIETPYFLPTEGLLSMLQSSALGGVDVRIMVPRRSDSAVLTYASSSYVSECLRAGIKIYFYEPGMLHSKTMIVDDEMVTIGSTNFDFRSFEHNFEVNLFIYSAAFNEEMANRFHEALRNATRIFPDKWAGRSRVRRIKESLMRLLAPIL